MSIKPSKCVWIIIHIIRAALYLWISVLRSHDIRVNLHLVSPTLFHSSSLDNMPFKPLKYSLRMILDHITHKISVKTHEQQECCNTILNLLSMISISVDYWSCKYYLVDFYIIVRIDYIYKIFLSIQQHCWWIDNKVVYLSIIIRLSLVLFGLYNLAHWVNNGWGGKYLFPPIFQIGTFILTLMTTIQR